MSFTHPAPSATALLAALAEFPLVIAHCPAYVPSGQVLGALGDARLLDLTDEEVRDAVDWDPLAFLEGGARTVVFQHAHLLPRLASVLRDHLQTDGRAGRCLLISAVDPAALPAAHPDDALQRTVRLRAVDTSNHPDASVLASLLTLPTDGAAPSSTWGREDYVDRVLRGGVAGASTLPDAERHQWWEASAGRLVDASRAVIQVGAPERMHALLTQVAQRPGAELVRARLGAATGLPASSVTLYMNALVAAGAVDLLPAWTPGVTTREVVKPTAYPCDTALAVQRAGWSRAEVGAVSATSPLRSLLLTAVVGEILTRNPASEPFQLRHYRDRAGVAIPLIIELPDSSIVALDVAATGTPRDDLLLPLRTLQQLLGDRLRLGALLTLHPQPRRHEDGLWTLPLSQVWQTG